MCDIVTYKMYLPRLQLFWIEYMRNITIRYEVRVKNEPNIITVKKGRGKIQNQTSYFNSKGYNPYIQLLKFKKSFLFFAF